MPNLPQVDAASLDALAEKGADNRDIGPIRVLTHLRYWGQTVAQWAPAPNGSAA